MRLPILEIWEMLGETDAGIKVASGEKENGFSPNFMNSQCQGIN